MKRLISILSAGLLLLSLGACHKEEMVVLDPSKSTAPVLGTYEVTDGAVTAQFIPGQLNVNNNDGKNPVIYHFFALTSLDGNAVSKRINTSVKDNTMSASASNITRALKELGCEAESTHSIEIAVRASGLQQPQDEDVNTFVDSKDRIAIAEYTLSSGSSGGGGPQIPNIDLSQYEYLSVMEGAETWGIIGPAVSDWNTDVDMVKISDDPEVWYGHNIIFTADQFKFRGNDTWGDYDLGGGEFALKTPIALSKGGGNLTAEASAYDVYLFPTYGVAYIDEPAADALPEIDLGKYEYLSVMEGAETWGIIGPAVSDWNNDVDLEKISDDPEIWRGENVPFQADQFKFRGNDTWGDYDLGGGEFALDTPIAMTKGGGNITAPEAGSYTVYLYPTYGVAYIQKGSGAAPPAPDKPKLWSVIGHIGEDNWATDFDMTNKGGDLWVYEGLVLGEADEFKLRADHDWNKNVGGPEGNDVSTLEAGNAYEVYKPVLGEAFATGDKNIRVGVAGSYTVSFDYAASTITVSKSNPDNMWSVIGSVAGTNWDKDFYMTESEGVWTSDPLSFEAGSEFKLRFNNSWADADCVGAAEAGFAPASEVPFTGVHPGSNIVIKDAGTYQIVFKPETLEITVISMSNRYSLIGAIDGSNWDKDFFMTQDGDTWTYGPVFIGGEFKVRYNQSWDDANTYGTEAGFTPQIGVAFPAAQPGSNISVPEGRYIVVFDSAAKTITVKTEIPGNLWSVIGSVNGANWDKDFYMTEDSGIWVSDELEFTADSEFKLRFNNSWADPDTFGGAEGGIALKAGQAITPVHPGNNLKVAEPGKYRVVYDSVKGVIFLQGWALIGNINGTAWNKDFFMTLGEDGLWWSDELTIKDEFKIRRNSSWADADTRGMAEPGTVTLGSAFKTVGPGSNIVVPSEGKYRVSYDPAKEEATVHGQGGSGEGGSVITTAEQLIAYLADPTKDAELGADIDLTGKSFTSATQKGTLDGKGHKITYSLTVTEPLPVDIADEDRLLSPYANLGLFKFVEGTIKNLTVAGSLTLTVDPNPDTSKNDNYHLGGFAGFSTGTASFENCVNEVNLLANTAVTQHMGGLVGYAGTGSKFLNCTNKGSVKMMLADYASSRASQLGGIAGHIEVTATVENCTNDGEIFYTGLGTTRMAGIVGYVNKATDITFRNCVNNGNITSDFKWKSGYSYIGGITGYYGTISATGTATYIDCVNNGKLEAICPADGCTRIGGIASYGGHGDNSGNSNVFTFKSCSNNGLIKTAGETANKNPLGGIVAMGESSAKFVLEGCTMNGTLESASNYVGGLIGQKGGTQTTITDCMIGTSTVLKGNAKAVIGLFVGQNAKYVTAMTGKVHGGKIVKGETETAVTADNYASLIVGAALGTGGSVEGVTFGK